MVITLTRTDQFNEWLFRLRDNKARAIILNRLDRASLGNWGDCKPVGNGVSEMRIDFGPGYRIYFTRRGATVYLLLAGGEKSTQTKDIQQAKALLSALPKEDRK